MQNYSVSDKVIFIKKVVMFNGPVMIHCTYDVLVLIWRTFGFRFKLCGSVDVGDLLTKYECIYDY